LTIISISKTILHKNSVIHDVHNEYSKGGGVLNKLKQNFNRLATGLSLFTLVSVADMGNAHKTESLLTYPHMKRLVSWKGQE
jgi:hypothetical protein